VKSSTLCYFVAVILKVLLVNLLATANFANVFLNKKRLENKKNVKKRKKRDQNKKSKKNVFLHIYGFDSRPRVAITRGIRSSTAPLISTGVMPPAVERALSDTATRPSVCLSQPRL